VVDCGVLVQEIDVFQRLVLALHTLSLLRLKRDPSNIVKVDACPTTTPCSSVSEYGDKKTLMKLQQVVVPLHP
jgi:hypothetical protein